MNVLPAAHTIHRWLTRSSGALERNSGAATSAIAALVTTTSMARAERPTLANLKAVGRPVTAETYQPTHPLACACGRERARTGVSCVCRCAGGGGGAGHASHAVNDFRKLCHLESYAPTDNVSELTARTNDDGWETSFSAWLEISRLSERDALLVFSVGGGSRQYGVSLNLVNAVEQAHEVGAGIFGVVGSTDGTLAQLADIAIIIVAPPTLKTPLVESFQAVVWHALVSHPELAAQRGHWESVQPTAAP